MSHTRTHTHVPTLALALAACAAASPALAAQLALDLELPRVPAAKYRPPYVAIWIEQPDQAFVANLAVWYDLKKRNNAGTKWLNEVRHWWRASGRGATLATDGSSGPTRPPGDYALAFDAAQGPLATLPPGDYVLAVEASREHGGDEVLRLPFSWPPKAAAAGAAPRSSATGTQELGAVGLRVSR